MSCTLSDAGHVVGDVVERSRVDARGAAVQLRHMRSEAGERSERAQHRVEQHRQRPLHRDVTLHTPTKRAC